MPAGGRALSSGRRLMFVAWPAFLGACALELLVFSLVDPLEIHLAGGAASGSRQAVYTGAFFVFWVICMGSSALTAVLQKTARGSGSQSH